MVADLRIKGKSYGPHAFLVDMRVNGQLVKGIHLEDMGRKTIANDLDNASIEFRDFVVAKSTLLSRFADVRGHEYVQTTQEKMRIEVIGQRLLTGRVVVAQWALTFCQRLFAETKRYAAAKKCWMPGGETSLASLPHIAAMFSEAERTTARLSKFIEVVQAQLSQCLVKKTIPPPELVEAIAIAKIFVVDTSLGLCFRLKQEVGSYALMEGTGFEHIGGFSAG